MKLEIPLTKGEMNLLDKFYKEMEGVAEENKIEYEKNIYDSSINCTESALERIKNITDTYLKTEISLNSYCNDCNKTVTGLIFEEMAGVLDRTSKIKCSRISQTIKDGDPREDHEDQSHDDESEVLKGDSLDIIESIVINLLLKGGKIKRSSFYHRDIDNVTYGIDYDLFAQCKEIKNDLKNVAYEGVIN